MRPLCVVLATALQSKDRKIQIKKDTENRRGLAASSYTRRPRNAPGLVPAEARRTADVTAHDMLDPQLQRIPNRRRCVSGHRQRPWID